MPLAQHLDPVAVSIGDVVPYGRVRQCGGSMIVAGGIGIVFGCGTIKDGGNEEPIEEGGRVGMVVSKHFCRKSQNFISAAVKRIQAAMHQRCRTFQVGPLNEEVEREGRIMVHNDEIERLLLRLEILERG